MRYRVFIDGAEGTTGLRIHEYFRDREDVEILPIDTEDRKDPDKRLAIIRKADVSFLCLPDGAAAEIAAAAPKDCRLIDTSTKHRVLDDWTYGMPELLIGGKKMRKRIRESSRVANPGCHASGVIALLQPLLCAGALEEEVCISVTSLTGYSGGGKKMIAAYEGPGRRRPEQDLRRSPAQYGLAQTHKHIPEIMKMTGLKTKPVFLPVVADHYSGMEVMIPLHGQQLAAWNGAGGTKHPVQALLELYLEYYDGEPMIRVTEADAEEGFLYAGRLAGSNRMELSVHGSEETVVLTATFDNLGKGASGAAVQNMNIMLGIEETTSLL